VLPINGGLNMAPKFKFTKEEVLAVTIDFIRENGIEALTARELAKKLDSSTKVIFSLFSNMKNLEDEAKFVAENIFSEKVNLALKDDSPFKRLGVEYILFSKNEPKLFQWLFMKKGIEVGSFSVMTLKKQLRNGREQYILEKIASLKNYREYCLSNIKIIYPIVDEEILVLLREYKVDAGGVKVIALLDNDSTKGKTITINNEHDFVQKFLEKFPGKRIKIIYK